MMENTQRWRDRRDTYRQRGEAFHPSEFGVELIASDRTARDFVWAHHYSGSFPSARCRVGLYRSREGWYRPELVGVAVFSVPMSQAVIPKWAGVEPRHGIELGRFVLLDEVPFNAETWFLSRATAALRAELPELKALISFSDPVARTDSTGAVVTPGHVGTIYQARNAAYLGRTDPILHWLASSGRFLSPRALSKIRGGEQGWEYASRDLVSAGAPPRLPAEEPAAWLRRALTSGAFSRIRHPGNHAYLWRFDGKKVERGVYPKKASG
jgi:hypothetical protein